MPNRRSQEARSIVEDYNHTLIFSAASMWEFAIKSSLARHDFEVNARVLRRALLEANYQELHITRAHTAEVSDLPSHHKDPVDRILVAQARFDGVTLLTSDRMVAQYGPPARLV